MTTTRSRMRRQTCGAGRQPSKACAVVPRESMVMPPVAISDDNAGCQAARVSSVYRRVKLLAQVSSVKCNEVSSCHVSSASMEVRKTQNIESHVGRSAHKQCATLTARSRCHSGPPAGSRPNDPPVYICAHCGGRPPAAGPPLPAKMGDPSGLNSRPGASSLCDGSAQGSVGFGRGAAGWENGRSPVTAPASVAAD